MEYGRSNGKNLTVAELFCGCGGFSHGFAQTGLFDVVFGNDIKGPALTTFKENHRSARGKPHTINGDIREVDVKDIKKALKQKGVADGELDCLIGGPPCQGFSQARRSEEREDGEVKFGGYDRLSNDPRNDLVLRFLDIARDLHPKFIVIENVPQMLRHGYDGEFGGLAEAVVDILENDLGYNVEVAIMSAADYGVPQLRERAIFLASRVSQASLPTPTHAEPNTDEDLPAWLTVRDAIADLPTPPMGEDKLGGGSTDQYDDEMSDYAAMMRTSDYFPYNHITRSYSDRIIGIIEEMRPGENWDHASARMRKTYDSLVEEQRRPDEDRETAIERLDQEGVIKKAFYKDYYWSAYTRLAWEEPALTITANSNFLGSGRFSHPEQNRGITIREAARLQSFDDSFKFITSEDDLSDTERIGVGLDMIGEAVPPLLGKSIAEHIIQLSTDTGNYDSLPESQRDLFGRIVVNASNKYHQST